MPHGDQRSYVYIMASKSRALYTGVTSRLEARIREHKNDTFDGFTTRYRVHRLVYYESFRTYVPQFAARSRSRTGAVRRRLR
jgi:putative endonuclease